MNFNFKNVMGAILEDDSPATQSHVSEPPSLTPSAPPVVAVPVVATGDAPDRQDDAYQRLAAKTNWEEAPVFSAIQKHLKPMDGLSVDPKTKFTIAVKQAQEIDGVDPSAINQTFETLKATLQQSAADFAQKLADRMESDVTSKKKQAEQLQIQVQQLTEEAFASEQKLQTAKHKFDVALQTRLAEINQEQAKYTSLLA